MKDPYKKWRDPHVLFLDDGFDCNESYTPLIEAGFSVQRFSDHFKRDCGSREQGVLDPRVIALCNQHGWILLTTDSAMIRVHRRVIEQASNLGILATVNNSVPDIEIWVSALIKLKPKLEQNNFKKRARPWFGTFTVRGTFGIPVGTVRPLSRTTI